MKTIPFPSLAKTAALLLATSATLLAQTDPLNVATALASGQAAVTHTTIDIGPIANLFDGNTASLARTQSINPMVVTLLFTTPKELARSRVWFLAGNNRSRVETADSVADLDSATGSYRLALDWTTGAEASWQDRTLAAPITCRAIRLQLQRLTGDDYVHLNEWQLYLRDRPFAITDIRKTGSDVQLTWNSALDQWYEIQSSPDLAQWNGLGFQKGLEDATAASISAVAGDCRYFRIRKAAPEDRPSIVKRVLVLNLNPILEAHGNQRLSRYLGWNDPNVLTATYLNDLTAASGGYVQWQLAATVDLDLWPPATDGFQYTDTTYLQSWFNSQQYPWHMPNGADYNLVLDLPLPSLGNKTAHQMAASGEVDEIVVWGAPYMSILYESWMVGATAYFCNAPELIRTSRLYVVMGLNYERGIGEALHSFGHRCESILARVYGSWSGNATVNHLWDRFTRVGPTHGVSVAGCGNVHFPPNASADYEYSVFSAVTSEADRWLSFPNLSGALVGVNANSWGGPDHQRNYLRWWMTRFPKAPGRYVDATNPINHGKLNNWWGYTVDMNEYAESR